MQVRALGATGQSVSVLGLGGHEFHDDGRMRGLSDNLAEAAKPGYRRDDFGGPGRQALVAAAVASGATLFDVTIDPEVEALGRNLRALPGGAGDALVQMRPQGMCYSYEAGNAGLADASRLTAEVDRLRALSGQDRIGILNIGFEWPALEAPGYLKRLADALAALKASGRIALAGCDGLWCGEPLYLRMIEAGCFDVVWINLNPLCPAPLERVIPAARAAGMGVIVREAFAKGRLPAMARETLGADDVGAACAGSLRWILRQDVDSLVIGARSAAEWQANLAVAAGEGDGERADETLARLLATGPARAAAAEMTLRFEKGSDLRP